jgi:predicted transcriptional regulator
MIEFTKEDEELVNFLVSAGIKKNIGKTLSYLRKVQETTSVEIERATGLRQPEVSISMQWLEKKQWIIKRDIKKEGKGRPVFGYRLSKPFKEIIEDIEKDLKSKIDLVDSNIAGLKKFL